MNNIAAIYNVWDGEELLPFSVEQIKNRVRHIIFVVQTVGNSGVKSLEGLRVCHELRQKINSLPCAATAYVIEYEPTEKDFVKRQIQKRNAGINYAVALGADAVMCLDTDEIVEGDLEGAYELFKHHNADIAVAQLWTYIGEPALRLSKPDITAQIALLQKPIPITGAPTWAGASRLLDYERTISYGKGKSLALNIDFLCVHHYSWVRKDLQKKIDAHAMKAYIEGASRLSAEVKAAKAGSRIAHYRDNLISVPNKFGISW
jgi:hypothetical protein